MTTRQIWTRLLSYVGRYRSILYWSAVCAILSVASSLAGPYYIGKAVDAMTEAGQVDFPAILRILLILGIIYGAGSLFGWLLAYLMNQAAYKTVDALRQDLFGHIGKLPLSFHDNHPHGDSISRFINDMDMVSDGLQQGFSSLLTGIVTIAGSIVLMFYISPLMAVIVLLSAPAAYYAARYITTRSQKLFREQAKTLGELNGYVEEMVGGQKIVQAFHYEAQAMGQFKEKNNRLYEAGVKSQFLGSLANPTTRLVNNVTFSVIAMVGGVAAIMNSISVGGLSSFLIYANLFAKPFNEITGVLTQLQSATASAQRIFTIMDMPQEKPEPADAVAPGPAQGTVEFRHVAFAYNPVRPLISDFSLTVKPGTRVAIVGQTGAGKTTLVNLLMRFYDVDRGEITLNGINIKHMTRDSLRRSFGMVLQETWLFGGTIRDNIAYGKSDATDAEVEAAARAANAHSFIRRLPEGYSTVISGTGDSLSQGQKQLLTIARVMLVDPPMLILDEATSSIDTRTELRIQEAFLRMIEGRTSFVIAHRLSTIREADMILYMQNGDIVEAGSHDELLAQGGAYRRLYESQFAAG